MKNAKIIQAGIIVAGILCAMWILLFCAGCTSTKVSVEGGRWTMSRWSVLQKLDIPSISIFTNGMIELKGYANDGGNDALKNVIDAAVSAAVKAAK